MGHRVFISAGEASGDAYGAALIRKIKALQPGGSLRFEGIGAARCAAESTQLWANSASWGAIGVAQAVRAFPRIVSGYYRAKRQLRIGVPGLFLPIDFGYANIRLARHAKRHGWKVLYFVPPGSWKRDRQGADLPKIADEIVTPFSWSADLLKRMGANAHWFGHPIKELITERLDSFDVSACREGLAVLPGSRYHEIEANLPLLAQALEGFEKGLTFALAPSLDQTQIEIAWKSLSDLRPNFVIGDTAGVLLQARAAIVCSGTATLEAALCNCPMVAFYQLTPAMKREVVLLRFKRPKYFVLPNILLDRLAVPELADLDGVDPRALRAELEAIWKEGEARSEQLSSFQELDKMLGPAEAITRAAELAVQMLATT